MAEQPPDEPRPREEGRPDPEELLRRYSLRDRDLEAPPAAPAPGTGAMVTPQPAAEGYPHRRGRLRVYLASAAGAGKTYTMLNEGHRRESRGTDVVVGYVETHGRAQTQSQIGDLEVILRKKVTYRGVTLEEMDTEAIIVRHPKVTLIDELAHTNVPGSRHVKRYQDDEVELIDISPYALRQRMRHGNIYPPDRVEPALNNFFREGNLTALRELALRRTAEKTEEQLQQYMTEHGITEMRPATERVLVGFDARPHTREVIRDAWRLAHGLRADLLAISIQPEGYLAFTSKLIGWLKYRGDVKRYREAALRHLEEHALLAEDLGAEVIRVKSRDIAKTLVEVAKERQVTQLVLGQPARSRWEELIRGSIINRVLRMSSDIDIHLVPRESDE